MIATHGEKQNGDGKVTCHSSLRDNDQVHRARGPTGLTFEHPKSVNEGEDVEKPKDERAPRATPCYAAFSFRTSWRVDCTHP